MPQREGKDTCMGFVDFENDDQCQQALAMDGTELEGHNLSVQLASGGT